MVLVRSSIPMEDHRVAGVRACGLDIYNLLSCVGLQVARFGPPRAGYVSRFHQIMNHF